MFLALMLVSALSFSADLPEGIPDISAWPVAYSRTFDRTLGDDLASDGELKPFVESRGICPKGSPRSCKYHVRYEYRPKIVGGLMVDFTQRFIVTGDNGTREEGVVWYDRDRFTLNPGRGFRIYYRKGAHWNFEDADGEERLTAFAFVVMLARMHPPQLQ